MVLIGQNFRFAKLFGVFLWISYVLVILLIYSLAEENMFFLRFRFIRMLISYEFYLELSVGVFACIYLLNTLIQIKKFCKLLCTDRLQINEMGYLVQEKL
jgi:hypothetical protein